MSESKKRNWFNWVLWTILVLVAVFIGLHFFSYSSTLKTFQAKRVQRSVVIHEESLSRSKEALSSLLASEQSPDFDSLFAVHPNASAYIFLDDSLVYWNANMVEARLLSKRTSSVHDTIVHIHSGDYLLIAGQQSGYRFYLYSLINTTYSLHDANFDNSFQLIPGHFQLTVSPEPTDTSFPFLSPSGEVLAYFELLPPGPMGFHNPNVLPISMLLLVLTIYLLILRRISLSKQQKAKSDSNATETSSETPDKTRSSSDCPTGFKVFLPFLLLLLFFTVTVLVFKYLFQFGFTHGYFLPDGIFSGVVILVFSLSLLLFVSLLYLLHKYFVNRLRANPLPWLPILAYVALVIIVSLIFHFHWFIALLGIVVMVIFVITTYLDWFTDMSSMTLLFVFWGLLFTVLYDHEYTLFENHQIEELAVDLADERDPEFENSYHQFLALTQHDTTFFSMILSKDIMDEVAEDYIHTFLFDSVMDQYNVKLTLCNPGAELVVEPYNQVSDCMGYFQDKVNNNHGVDLGDGLAFLDYNSLDPSYLSMINIVVNDTITDISLFFEFSKPIAPQGYGLLKFFQSGSSSFPSDASVACYEDQVLIYKYGSYIYPNYMTNFHFSDTGFSEGRKMKHFIHQVDESKNLVISVPRRGFSERMIPFVIFFSVILVLFLIMYFGGGLNPSITPTLSRKFQLMVLLVLGITLLILGVVSVVYMKDVYKNKSDEFHFERTQTLMQNITSEVDFAFMKRPGFKYELEHIMQRYSETFYTDINVYGLDGKLLCTTSPEIQELHLQAPLMNAKAFQRMRGNRYLYYLNDEKLGNATFSSAYISILDNMGNTVAYLNTPYYSSRLGLHSEVVNFILIYSNIILLFGLAILFLILYFTYKVSKPLVELQDKMHRVDINKTNEILDWKSNDEVGKLVTAYNKLVREVEQSALELKRTTTEVAWRSAARQVAHEINNSLTPMRLYIQILESSVNKHPDEIKERIQNTSKTLIEEIDVLTSIANSFYSFAKLPENHPEPLDLSELVTHVLTLYDNIDNIEFEFVCDKSQDYMFNGDKTNLNRAVTNLVKNATQAIDTKPDGKIIVTLKSAVSSYVLSVKDNGKGIKEADKEMIFLPNFTTKTGGSGIGLSLTYNIVQSAGGSITFESQEGEGAEFIIELPKNLV